MKLLPHIIKPYISGLHLGSYTYLFSNILDHTISRQQTMELIQKNPQLYIQSTVSNLINLIGLSPIYYIVAENLLLHDKTVHIQWLKTLAIILTHNLIFYKLHKLFHENKSLYFIHKFHHKFVKPIPSNGNAVSILEYNSAYVAPFLIGALIFKPNGISFQLAIAVISVLNSLVHCIPLKNIRLFPIFVAPNDHLIHHEKLTTKYASPFFNVDTMDKIINKYYNITDLQRNNKYRNTVGL
jgi:sterol desaturase/sphingolipid hydroxylase (fatty acid hydroxylase superfamily)